jgi:LemA protein
MLAVANLGLWIAIGAGAVVVLWAISSYNGLVTLRNRTKTAWSQIDVQLKRRYDLIPNLVETCKGYIKHERETLEAVVKARQQAVNLANGSPADRAAAENMLSSTLRSLFAVAESYPDLKANQNMLQLQEELTSTENKISFSRQHYNDEVMRYNTKTEVFPTTILAGLFRFGLAQFFELESPEERKAPKVQF